MGHTDKSAAVAHYQALANAAANLTAEQQAQIAVDRGDWFGAYTHTTLALAEWKAKAMAASGDLVHTPAGCVKMDLPFDGCQLLCLVAEADEQGPACVADIWVGNGWLTAEWLEGPARSLLNKRAADAYSDMCQQHNADIAINQHLATRGEL